MDTSSIADTWGPRCRCGLYQIGASCPYCENNRSGFSGEESPTKRTRAQMREDAAIRLEKTREKSDWITRTMIQQARSAANDAAFPSVRESPKKKKPRAPRRTKAEMAQFRAAQAARLQEVAALKTPSWLSEDDPATEAILAGTDVEEAMESNVTEQITALLAGEDGE